MGSSLKTRVEALEGLVIDDSWVIMECINQPTQAQLEEMKAVHLQGRMTLLFIELGNTLWKYGQPKPWELTNDFKKQNQKT